MPNSVRTGRRKRCTFNTIPQKVIGMLFYTCFHTSAPALKPDCKSSHNFQNFSITRILTHRFQFSVLQLGRKRKQQQKSRGIPLQNENYIKNPNHPKTVALKICSTSMSTDNLGEMTGYKADCQHCLVLTEDRNDNYHPTVSLQILQARVYDFETDCSKSCGIVKSASKAKIRSVYTF